jgi:hypothetical protein
MNPEIFCENPTIEAYKELSDESKKYFFMFATLCKRDGIGDIDLATKIIDYHVTIPSETSPRINIVPTEVRKRIREGSLACYNVYGRDGVIRFDDKVIHYVESMLTYYEDRYKDSIYLKGNLTNDEMSAIYTYKDAGYEPMNIILRGIKLDPIFYDYDEYYQHVVNLKNIFAKTIKTRKNMYVFRGIKYHQCVEDEINETGELILNGFTSTTINMFKTVSRDKFSGSGCCVFVIKIPPGIPVIFPDIELYIDKIKQYGSIVASWKDERNTKQYRDYIQNIFGEGEVILSPGYKLIIHDTFKLGEFGGNIGREKKTYYCTCVRI